MRQNFLVLCLLLGSQQLVQSADPKLIFEDALKEKLGTGWDWLRENPKTWRHSPLGLEIRVEPGLAGTVKNALVRNAPDRSQGKCAIEVTVEFTSPPSQQYEQAELTWYHGNKSVFKLVHEHIDGKSYVIPGKKLVEDRLIELRLVVTKDQFIAQFRPGAKGEFETAASGKLATGSDEKVSIQCYNGPSNDAHWIRLSDFRIIKFSE
jgi:hypothetical protein